MTGKKPADFAAITGTREVAEPAGRASDAEAGLLAALDLESVSEALTGESLQQALAPVFEFYGVSCHSTQEDEVLSTLHQTLVGRPYVNQLVNSAAGSALALRDLAQVFAQHPRAERALEALLTLGTLARPKSDAPGWYRPVCMPCSGVSTVSMPVSIPRAPDGRRDRGTRHPR